MLFALLGSGRLFVMHVRRNFWFVIFAREEGLIMRRERKDVRYKGRTAVAIWIRLQKWCGKICSSPAKTGTEGIESVLQEFREF